MKTKYKYLIAILLAFGFITYGFVKINSFTPIFTSPPPPTPQEAILGTWILEGESNNLRVFTSDDHVKIIINGVVQSDDTYTISDTCDGYTNGDGSLFLNTIDSEDGTEYCEIINGINANDSNVLSLTTDSGQLLVYHKP
jgi:hypothetical protein